MRAEPSTGGRAGGTNMRPLYLFSSTGSGAGDASTIPPTPDSGAKLHLAKEHLHDLVTSRGSHGLLIARKHMSWTCTGFPGASQLRHALMRAPTPDDAYQLLDNAIDNLRQVRAQHGTMSAETIFQ